MNWIVLGRGFGIEIRRDYLGWIYWAPGTQTQEGRVSWAELGINPGFGPGAMMLSDADVVPDLISAGILDKLAEIVEKRNQPSDAAKLGDRLFKECPHYRRAMLLAKSAILDIPGLVPGYYRHNCTPYDDHLRDGKDRDTLRLRYHNDLVEIMRFYEENREEILQTEEDPTVSSSPLQWHKRLASVDHDAVIREAVALSLQSAHR